MNKAFFDDLRSTLGPLNQSQVDGINTICLELGIQPIPTEDSAYILATAWHETGTKMQPVEEIGKGAGHPYGLPTGPWHQVYDGRGDAQLTWEGNYVKATSRLREHLVIDGSIDLEKTPELAMRPDIAAAILVFGMVEGWFTGKKLSDFPDYVSKRGVVNGTDRADLIAHYAIKFEHALKAAGWVPHVDTYAPVTSPKSPPPAAAPPPVPSVPVAPSTGGGAPAFNPMARIIGIILSLIGAYTVWYTSH